MRRILGNEERSNEAQQVSNTREHTGTHRKAETKGPFGSGMHSHVHHQKIKCAFANVLCVQAYSNMCPLTILPLFPITDLVIYPCRNTKVLANRTPARNPAILDRIAGV